MLRMPAFGRPRLHIIYVCTLNPLSLHQRQLVLLTRLDGPYPSERVIQPCQREMLMDLPEVSCIPSHHGRPGRDGYRRYPQVVAQGQFACLWSGEYMITQSWRLAHRPKCQGGLSRLWQNLGLAEGDNPHQPSVQHNRFVRIMAPDSLNACPQLFDGHCSRVNLAGGMRLQPGDHIRVRAGTCQLAHDVGIEDEHSHAPALQTGAATSGPPTVSL